VDGDDNCDHVVVSVGAFVRDEVRRGTPGPGLGYALAIPRHQLAQLRTSARPGQEPGREWFLEHRPRSTALRI
jgi:hypothetical protein